MLQMDAVEIGLASQMARGILDNELPIYTYGRAQKTRRAMIKSVIRSQMNAFMVGINFPKLGNL